MNYIYVPIVTPLPCAIENIIYLLNGLYTYVDLTLRTVGQELRANGSLVQRDEMRKQLANWWGDLQSHYPKSKPQHERLTYDAVRDIN